MELILGDSTRTSDGSSPQFDERNDMRSVGCALFSGLLLGWLYAPHLIAADDENAPAELTVEAIAEKAKASIASVRFLGRDGDPQGLGTGFVIDPAGLIATNLHVIGEARPISVQLADGRKFDVVAVHATERAQDLAILKIDAQNLTPLPLGNSDQLREGQAVVAIGNPLGLERSVVAGVLSARREIDSRMMLQVAIPIERGNSGGPLLDRQGRVHGIMTLKSQQAPNLGFAVPINALKPLISQPNPIPIDRWLTVGAIDPAEWVVTPGSRWRQRAGRIFADARGPGGFGGRALCLATAPPPAVPFELAVTLRYSQTDGAAGLVFHADGGNKHYGFYPSSGEMRLTRFEGPDVYSWTVLRQVRSPHWRDQEWNTIKVRVEAEKFLCYVNDQLVFEQRDTGLTSGKVGLCKFRHTEPEFKRFRVASEIPLGQPPATSGQRVQELTDPLGPEEAVSEEILNELASLPQADTSLTERAATLERRAAAMRQLAGDVRSRQTLQALRQIVEANDDQVDLLRGALLLSKLDNPDLEVEEYVEEVDRMVRQVRTKFAEDAAPAVRLAALDQYLFHELGFHGSRVDYHHRSNSYINEVLDDREGLPITLAVLYLELGKRLGIPLEGVALPGHFLVRFLPADGESRLIDVFDRGAALTTEQAREMCVRITEQPWRDEFLNAAERKAILIRMLRNLMGVARANDQTGAMLRYADAIVTIQPENLQERYLRAAINFQLSRFAASRGDLDWLQQQQLHPVLQNMVEELRGAVNREEFRRSRR